MRWAAALRALAALSALLAAVVLSWPAASGSAGTAAIPYPSSMAAIGDSLTLALTTPGEQADSWSTGTAPAVESHYLRILAANPKIKGHAWNLAQSGASFREMQGQARAAVARHAQYVTIWGGEDWCFANLSGLPRQFGKVLDILARGKPQPYVLVVSARNPATLYKLLQAHRAAVLHTTPVGATAGVCSLSIGSKPSEDAGNLLVSKAVQSISHVNATMARVCEHHPRCRFDNDAVFHMPIAFNEMASDYDHLTIAGQRHVAEVTWQAGFPFKR